MIFIMDNVSVKNKLILPEGCSQRYLTYREVIDKLKQYWVDNPYYIGYDSKISYNKDPITNAINKADCLLNRRFKEKSKFKRWLKREINKNTDIIQTYKQWKYKKGIGLASLTKTLHKIKPNKIPIIDSNISCIYKINSNNVVSKIKLILKHVKQNRHLLIKACECFSKYGIKITPLRAWDIIIFKYPIKERKK